MSRRHLRHPEAVPIHIGRPIQTPVIRWAVSLKRKDGQKIIRVAESYEEAREKAQTWLALDTRNEYDCAWIYMVQ